MPMCRAALRVISPVYVDIVDNEHCTLHERALVLHESKAKAKAKVKAKAALYSLAYQRMPRAIKMAREHCKADANGRQLFSILQMNVPIKVFKRTN